MSNGIPNEIPNTELKYMLIELNNEKVKGYSLACINVHEEAVVMLVDITLLMNIGKKVNIEVAWDGDICNVRSDTVSLRGKLFPMYQAPDLCKALISAFGVQENDENENNQILYKRIMSLKDNPNQVQYIDKVMRSRWVVKGKEDIL
jgi:hypothetical protein